MRKSFGLILFILVVNIFKVQAYSTVTGNCIYFDFQRLPGGNGFTGNYYDAPTFNWIDNITPKSGMYITNQIGTGSFDSNGTTTGVGLRSAYSAAGSTGIGTNVYSGMPSGSLALTLNTPLPASYGGTNTRTGPSTGLIYDHRYYIPISSGAGDFNFVSSASAFNIGTNASLYAIINNKTTFTGGVMFRVYTTNDIFSGVANLYYDAFLPPNTTTSVAFIIPNATQIKGMGVSFTNIVGDVDIKLINVFNAGFTATNPACITTASSTGITFTNNPTGSITGCYWDFGPGAIPATTITSGLNYPTVVFTSSGIKSINLTVTGFVTKTFTGIITISGPSLVGGISSTANTTCVNSAIVVSVAGTNGTIQWENSLNNSTYNSITGANASTYTTTLGTSMYYRARVTNGGCQTLSGSQLITINSIPGVSYDYNSNLPICATVNTIQANLTVGGTPALSYFTTTATGFTITSTGMLTFPYTVQGVFATQYVASVPGCALFTTTSVIVVNSIPGINNFSYGGPVCATALTKSITTITGTVAGGYFTTTAAGVTLNSLTGVWTFASTDQGNFWAVYNRSVAGCGIVSSAAGITINSILGVSYDYNSNLPICATVNTIQPNLTISGTPVSSYYSLTTTGFKINSITGVLTIPGTVQGVFAVNYVNSVPGCSLSTTTSIVTINSVPGITYSYSSPVCATVLTAQPAITGTIAGGYFTTTAIGLAINSVTGVWSFTGIVQGSFWAQYNRSVPGCGLVSSAAGITVNSILGVSYDYNGSLPLCATVNTAQPNLTVSGTPILSYYSLTATGFKINSVTGVLTIPGTVQGVFAANYVNSVPGCPLSTTTSVVTINSIPGINNFSYGGPVCATALTKPPTTITGTVSGGYFTTTATGLTLNSLTGVWTFASTDQGNFWAVYNRSVAGCGLVSSAAGITINSVLGVSYNYNNNLPICATDINAIPNITVGGTPVLSYYSLTATGFKVGSITGVLTFPGTVQGVFAANYVNSVPGCALSTTTSIVTINSVPGITYSYPVAVCATVLTAQPAITGTIAGGYFTTSATGVTINSITGVWTFANTDQGNFWAVYNRSVPGCGLVSSAAGITVNSILGVFYDYNSNLPICATVNTIQPNLTVNGTPVSSYFSLTATGFKINSVTGVLTFPYTVQGVFAAKYINSVPGCALSTTTSIVTINSVPGITYSYPVAVCATVLTAQPAITGTVTGGYFTTTATGLTINSLTGVWSFNGIVQGNFWAQYNRSIAGCGLVSSAAGITINSVLGVSYDYNSNLSICATDGSAIPNLTLTGTPVSSYYSLTATGFKINSVTGVLTFPYTVQGVFAAKYVNSVPGCTLSTTTSIITINSVPGITYSYAYAVCSTVLTAQPAITGTIAGGYFTTTATGLTINSITGVWTFANTDQGVFWAQYNRSVPGCGLVSSAAGITINSIPGISYDYNNNIPLCSTVNTAQPNLTVGGTFVRSYFTLTTTTGFKVNSVTGILTFPYTVQGVFAAKYVISVPGCVLITTTSIFTLNSIPGLNYNYISPVCSNASPRPVTTTGAFKAGGTFATTATGLTLNTAGSWLFATSVQGVFVSQYSISVPGCGIVTSSAGITINSVPGIIFDYNGAVCARDGSAAPNITSLPPGGYFYKTSPSISINSLTGVLTFASNVQNSFIIRYTLSVPGCGSVLSSTGITINAYQSPMYSYPSPVCATSGSAAPVITGSFTGGSFTTTATGITIDPSTGIWTFANTVQGDFEATYQTSIPGCGNIITTAGITINSVPGINYSYPGPICVTTGTATPDITGTITGGYFSSTVSGLTIDSNTGVLTFASSISQGVYTGQYNISVSGCGLVSVSGAVRINSVPDLPFSYPNPVCASKRFQAPDISLLQGGGKFISTSPDITVNSFNGVAFFPSTAQGTFYNKYVIIIPGCGTVNSTAGITINSIPGVSYSYSSTVCASEGQALPTITGLVPGGYFNTTATGLTIDATTGKWTFANTVSGDFFGKYNFLIGGCGLISSAASVTIHQTLNASVSITTLKDTICDGENALFTAIGINAGSAPLYTWKVNNVGFPSQSPFFSTINLKDQDNVSVVLKSNLSCLSDTTDASEIIRVTVTPSKFIIPIVITGGGDVCEGDNFSYSVNPISGASFVWTIPGEGSLISGQGTNGISVLYNALPSKGSYVSVMASSQCAVSDIIRKEVMASTTCIPAFKITNLITPNSNDDNSTWHIIGIEKYPNSEIKIYTSWGDLVFETKGYNNNTNAWNGKYNGSSVSTATYYYSIDLKNGSKIKTGYLTVRE